MKFKPWLVVLVRTFLVAAISLGACTVCFAYEIILSHPRLYFTSNDLPALQERTTTTHAVQWQKLLSWSQPDATAFKTYSGRDIDRTHRYIERNAFMYLMLADSNPALAEQHAQIAKNWMMELSSYEFTTEPNDAFEYLWALAIGYDWLYHWPGFSEAEKQQVRDQLVEHTNIHVNKTGLDGFPSFPTGPDTSKSIYDNMSTENNMANAFVGLALWEPDDRYGLNASAQRYMDAAYYRFQEMYKATKVHAPDGGYWEGQGYYGARFQGEVYFGYVWKVATGEDFFAQNDHIRNSVYYWIYGLRPDGVSSREGDQTCLPTGCDRNRFISEILADYYQDGFFQWYAHFKGALTGGDWPDMVFYNANLQARNPSSLPLYRNFKFGHVVVRTGWNIGSGSDDTYFTFHIHDWVSGHTHLDVNSFTLHRKGELAIDSGRYRGNNDTAHDHERNYALRTIAHNAITIYKPGEDFGSFSNDGGQEFLFKESRADDPRYVSDLYDGTRFDTATLEAFDVGPDYYYLKGNATDAYHSTGFHAPSDGSEAKISNFTREVVLYPEKPYPSLIVFDRVASLNKDWPKKWLLHSINEPTVNGDIAGVEVPGHIIDYEGDLVTINNQEGRLFSKTLLPAEVTIRKVGGTGYEFWVDDPGKNYPLGSDAASDKEAGAWRVEIEPAIAATDDTFLHFLSAVDSSVASMPPSSLINGNGVYGVETGSHVVLFSKTGNPLREMAYMVTTSSGTMKHLLTNISPGTYQVTQNGLPVPNSPFTTNNQNVIVFESTGGGAFSMNRGTGIADLIVAAVGDPPTHGARGSSFLATDTVRNQGTWDAGASTTRYYLSSKPVKDAQGILLTGSRSVPGLPPGKESTGSVTVVIPPSITFGTYYLLACADDGNVVGESDEANNCAASSRTIAIDAPDLAVTAVSNPPAIAGRGAKFPITDTTGNQGTASSGPSTTRYYLSINSVKKEGDILLAGSRSVAGLTPGAQSTGTVTVTIPSNASLGTYYLLACADDKKTVAEIDETNNCRSAESPLRLDAPDLVATAVSDPPGTAAVGAKFQVTDTVRNQGALSASSSRTRYYFSIDRMKDGDDELLAGSRTVSPLSAGTESTGSTTLTIPSSTLPGTYYLLACADDTKIVNETDEGNNCIASSRTITLDFPDLVVTALSDPPPTAKPGGKFQVTDIVRNQGTLSCGSSKTYYYLSGDTTKDSGDKILTGYRSVGSLSVGAESTGTVMVTIPSSTVPGTYYLLGCADGGGGIKENGETNNCLASKTRIVITP